MVGCESAGSVASVKILHVAASYLPAVRYGGTITSVHGLCRALASRGHQVHVFTTSVDGAADSCVPHDTAVDVEGVSVHYFRSRYLRRLYWSPPLGRALRDRIREFDVVHTHAIYLWPLWAAARRARAAGVPYVVSPRGMLEKALIERHSTLAKALLIGMIEKGVLERAAAIHVTSRREAEEIEAFGFDLPPVVEIPNGVDVETASAPSLEPGDGLPLRYALFLGRVSWKKGLDRLIASLPHVPELSLVIAGPDDRNYRLGLEKLAQRVGVADRTCFVGPVTGSRKAALITGATCLVLASYSENFGNVVLEAMAAGCPVVVTEEVGIADIVRDCDAGLVVPGRPDALGSAMALLAADEVRRRQLGERGRAAAHTRFGWDIVAQSMEALYASVLDERADT